ncbi:olfactory receptor 1019-like [Rhinatrema bivittatum]|uniref:olfactory receptor 1019-like n=1 Tax=Rhinatrema bivittatum TaxID=194408 RepID=UPI0011263B5A|nr:olfactory receptor 1019-like [Rhinatrema bivittatum]
MAEENHTLVTEFLLLGFTNDSQLQFVLFVVFLMIYLMTLLGNFGIILLIQLDPRLHTPMYFFLCNLSFVDLCCSSAITPKILVNFLSENKAISYLGCAAQLYFFLAFACTDNFLLAAMAYDRYVAICNPLLYPVLMTRKVCTQLASIVYIAGFLYSILQTGNTFRLSFCRSNVINHFFCDIPPLLKLSCMDTYLNEIVLNTFAVLISLPSILVILISYTSILSNVLRIRSAEGRRKAFSTCASHFVSVTLFYGSALFMYLRPSSAYSLKQDRIISVFYTVVIPMLNPLIYCLRNQEVKAALRKISSENIISKKLNAIRLGH